MTLGSLLHCAHSCHRNRSMTTISLPYRATADEACAWLAFRTGTPWTLARLLEQGGLAYVWLDYSVEWAHLFADGVTRYAAPIVFIEDTRHLAAGGARVSLRLTRDSGNLPIQLPGEGMLVSKETSHFQERDLQRLLQDILQPP